MCVLFLTSFPVKQKTKRWLHRAGNLRFNQDLTSSVVHPTNGDRHVICTVCGTTTSSTSTNSMPYQSAAGSCDGTSYCTLTSQADCEAGANALGFADTSANLLNSASQVRTPNQAVVSNERVTFPSTTHYVLVSSCHYFIPGPVRDVPI